MHIMRFELIFLSTSPMKTLIAGWQFGGTYTPLPPSRQGSRIPSEFPRIVELYPFQRYLIYGIRTRISVLKTGATKNRLVKLYRENIKKCTFLAFSQSKIGIMKKMLHCDCVIFLALYFWLIRRKNFFEKIIVGSQKLSKMSFL